MAKMPFFPMWIQDYLADTSHLDATEHGVYHLLLYRYWLNECRALPEDMTVLRRIARCRTRGMVERILTEFWQLSTGEGWHHKRAKVEFRAARDRSYAQSEKAKKRWKIKDDTNAEAYPTAMPPSPSPSPEEEELDMKDISSPNFCAKVGHRDKCPFSEIVKLYHEVLCPPLPAVEKLTETRRGYIRQRWQEDLRELDHWRNYFNHVKRSDFLMGRGAPSNGSRKPFRASLEWLTRPSNFAKVAEEQYH